MLPTFYLFGRQIGLFAVLVIVGSLVAGTWACYVARRRGYDDNPTIIVLLFVALGAFIGGFLLYGLLNVHMLLEVISDSNTGEFNQLWVALRVVFGGTVFFGGLVGGLIGGVICIYKMDLPFREYSDMLVPAIPLFHIFGRIGCFLAGCCYGIESNLGFTIRNSLVASANNVRRLPIQLIESLINAFLFLLLASMLKRRKGKGMLLLIYIVLYSSIRFMLEFGRGDTARGIIFGMSTSQFISLILLLVCISYIAVSKGLSAKLKSS